MGIAASAFYSSDPAVQTLHRRIVPTDEQFGAQQEYWKDLAEFLKPDLASRSQRQVITWLQGSYKFATQVRPARKGDKFDIDLGAYFACDCPHQSAPHSARELKEMIQRSLVLYADDPQTDATGVTSPKEFCSRIVFRDGFHIDVPAYHEWGEVRSLASATSGYVERDPVAVWNWWLNQFTEVERPRARRIVRYFKIWASLKFDPKTDRAPSSIMMTVLVAHAYRSLRLGELAGDDELLGAVVNKVREQLDDNHSNVVQNPVDNSENLNRLGDAFPLFRMRLGEFEQTCFRALAAGSREVACETWSEIFEHFFPLPSAKEIAEVAQGYSRERMLAFVPEVEITVRLPGNGRSYVVRNGAVNIPRDSKLDFRLVNSADAPANSQVRWVVRNEGAAAERKNDLGHLAGYGDCRLDESAQYKGRHYMDVSVRSGGAVIGVRRVAVSVIDNRVERMPMRRLFRNKKH